MISRNGIVSSGYFEERRLIFLIFLLSVIIRLIYALSNPALPTIIDSADFDIIAYNLSLGNGFGYGTGDLTSWRAPAYPFFLAGIYSIFGHNYWSVWFAEALLGGLLPVLIFYLAKNVFAVPTAIIASLLCIFHPKLIVLVNMGLAENLFSVLLAAMMLVLFRMMQHATLLTFFLAGILMGITLLCKIIFLPYILFVVPLALYVFPGTRDKLPLYVITISAALLVLAPWVIRNYLVHGQFVLMNTNGGFTLWYNNNDLSEEGYFWGATAQKERQKRINRQIEERERLIDSPESLIQVMTPVARKHYWKVLENVGTPGLRKEFENLDEVEADRLFLSKALNHITTHKFRFIKKSVRSAVKFFHVFDEGARYQYLWGILTPFWVLGLLFSFKNWRNYLGLYGLILTIWAVSTVFESSVRYRVPIEPVFFIFGAFGMTRLFNLNPKLFFSTMTAAFCVNLPGILYPEKVRFMLRNLLHTLGFDLIPW